MKKFLLFFIAIPIALNSQVFSENFESGTFPPTGWTINQVNTSETWKTLDSNAPEGSYGAQVQYDAALAPQNEDLISPSIDLSSVTSATLSFISSSSYYWGVDPNDNYDISAHISTDGGTTWVEIWNEDELATQEGGTFNSFQVYTIVEDISSYVGNSDVKLRFNYNGTDGAQWSLDDIKIETCSSAVNPTMSAYTSTSADLTWDNTGNFELEWGEYPYEQGNGGSTATVTGGTTYSFTSLSPATSYNVFIRQDCGGGSYSEWEELLIGTIPETVSTFPYTEDFTADANQALLLNLGLSFAGDAGNWSYGLDDNTDGDTTNDYAYDPLAYIYSNSTFTDSDSDAWVYVGPFTLETDKEYTFSFQQRNRVASDATTPNKDFEVAVSDTNDGTNNTILASFDDTDNLTYTLREATFTPSAAGDYYFGIHDKSTVLTGVTAANLVIVDALSITSEDLSVEDINSVTSVTSIYPNPVKDNFSVKLAEGFEVENTVVTINDLSGKEVRTFKYAEEFNVSSLEKGVYIISISDGANTESRKLVKE